MQHLLRRAAKAILALCVCILPLVGAAQPKPYPDKPIRLIIGFPPGSSTDVGARIVAQRMGDLLGQQVIVDNRAGASSNIGARAAATSPPDGYTLFLATIANMINVTFQPANSVDVAREFVPVAMLGNVPNLLVVHPSLGVSTVQQLIEAARKDPGRITYGSSGTGTSPHLSGELFDMKAGVSMLHIPYKGSSQAVTDLVAGQVQVMFSPASTVLPFIRSGQLKALAVASNTRTAMAPDLPTVAEAGVPGFETSVWFGIVAPRGTPSAVVERLTRAVADALDTPETASALKAQGIDVVKAGPEAFSRLMQTETDKWAQVIRAGNIKAE